jgi:DIS3-like exonuclease 2
VAYEDAIAGINLGKYVVGKLRISGKNRTEAYVTIDGLGIDIFLDGDRGRNRSLEGDLVVIALEDKSKWKIRDAAPTAETGSSEGGGSDTSERQALWCPRVAPDASASFETYVKKGGNASEQSDGAKDLVRTLEEIYQKESLQPVGQVVHIKKRLHTAGHVGLLEPITRCNEGQRVAEKDNFVRFKPMDSRFPFMMLPKSQAPKEFIQDPNECESRLYKCEVESAKWNEKSRFPLCTYICKLGEAGDIEVETRVLLEEFGFARRGVNGEFDDAVHACLESFRTKGGGAGGGSGYVDQDSSATSWSIPSEEIQRRRDLRNHRIFTIDPATAKDLDDALHITNLGDGNFEIGVHIADVSYFVRPGNPLDVEASIRATTVYLVQKSLPMLPRLLSENLCSLNPNVDRLAYSCIWTMNRKGEMVEKEPWYGRTIIRSCCKLDYGLAQDMIDKTVLPADAAEGNAGEAWPVDRRPTGGHTPEQVIADVKNLHMIAMGRRRRRFASGSLALNQPKLCFGRDDDGRPIRTFTYPLKDSNRLVEEYMLLANYLVAEKLILGAGGLAVIRRHPTPPKNKLMEFTQKVLKRGVHLRASTAGELQKTLQEATKNHSDPALRQVLTSLATVPMKPAVYFAAGTIAQEKWVHYALNIPYYTHFTSPIRRYADVMVHRMLTAVLEDKVSDVELGVQEIEETLEHCNEKKTKSKEAQDRCDRVFFCLYIKGKDIETEGVVSDWGTASFEVYLPEFGVSKRLHKNDLKCGMKVKEKSFVLVPETKRTVERGAPGPSAAVMAPSTTPSFPRLDESKLTELTKKKDRNEDLEGVDAEMNKLVVSQYGEDKGSAGDELLPTFKNGDVNNPVFTMVDKFGKRTEVAAQVMGRATKDGIEVVYVRNLAGKKVEMMVPSNNKHVDAPSSSQKQSAGSGKGKKHHGGKRSAPKGKAKGRTIDHKTEGKGERNGKMLPGILTEKTELKMLSRVRVRIYFIKRMPADFGLEILDFYDFDPIDHAKATGEKKGKYLGL